MLLFCHCRSRGLPHVKRCLCRPALGTQHARFLHTLSPTPTPDCQPALSFTLLVLPPCTLPWTRTLLPMAALAQYVPTTKRYNVASRAPSAPPHHGVKKCWTPNCVEGFESKASTHTPQLTCLDVLFSATIELTFNARELERRETRVPPDPTRMRPSLPPSPRLYLSAQAARKRGS